MIDASVIFETGTTRSP